VVKLNRLKVVVVVVVVVVVAESVVVLGVVTFCVSRRRRKMYCGYMRLCVCLSVRGRTTTLLHGPDVTWGRGRGSPLVLHYWVDLQSGHGLHCYGNITRTLVTGLRPSHDMTT